MAAEPNLEAYSQANEDLRHFSALRLKALGTFTAILGGVFVFAVDHLKDHPRAVMALSVFSIMISISGIILEWRINQVAEFYADKVDDLAKELGMSAKACGAPEKTILGKWLGSIPGYLVYIGSSAMWLYAWLKL